MNVKYRLFSRTEEKIIKILVLYNSLTRYVSNVFECSIEYKLIDYSRVVDTVWTEKRRQLFLFEKVAQH